MLVAAEWLFGFRVFLFGDVVCITGDKKVVFFVQSVLPAVRTRLLSDAFSIRSHGFGWIFCVYFHIVSIAPPFQYPDFWGFGLRQEEGVLKSNSMRQRSRKTFKLCPRNINLLKYVCCTLIYSYRHWQNIYSFIHFVKLTQKGFLIHQLWFYVNPFLCASSQQDCKERPFPPELPISPWADSQSLGCGGGAKMSFARENQANRCWHL